MLAMTDALNYATEGAKAERLAEQVRETGSLDPVYASLDDLIAEIEREYEKPSDLLPADAEAGIGFSLNQKRDGKTLWQAIAVSGRASLCDPGSEVRKKLSAGGASAGSLVSMVMVALGLPLIAVPIAVAVVSVLLWIGVDGFCKWASSPVDEPAEA